MDQVPQSITLVLWRIEPNHSGDCFEGIYPIVFDFEIQIALEVVPKVIDHFPVVILRCHNMNKVTYLNEPIENGDTCDLVKSFNGYVPRLGCMFRVFHCRDPKG